MRVKRIVKKLTNYFETARIKSDLVVDKGHERSELEF
jgi:hypothetical protein